MKVLGVVLDKFVYVGKLIYFEIGIFTLLQPILIYASELI